MSFKSVINQLGDNAKKQTRLNHFFPSYTHNALEAVVQGGESSRQSPQWVGTPQTKGILSM